MDATVTAVIRLWEQEMSVKEISRRLGIGHQKVTQILVTSGMLETEESVLYRQDKTPEEIAEILGKSVKSVSYRIPYTKCMYNAEYPTINALRIRKTRCSKGGKNEATDM